MDGLDWDAVADLIADLVYSEGEHVYSLEWDSGGPGGGVGTESVYAWRERYWVNSSTFGLTGGPFDTLEDALQGDVIAITDATERIVCPDLPDEDLIGLLRILAPQGHKIRINGNAYVVVNGQIQMSEGGVSSPSFIGPTESLQNHVLRNIKADYPDLTDEEIEEASMGLINMGVRSRNNAVNASAKINHLLALEAHVGLILQSGKTLAESEQILIEQGLSPVEAKEALSLYVSTGTSSLPTRGEPG